jgi:hypothetical protein
MKRCLPVVLILFTAAAAFPVDLGIVLGGEGECADTLSLEGVSVAGSVGPWFSAVFSEKANFYVSGKMTLTYSESQGIEPFVFEPERTELNLHPASALYMTLGRQRFEDTAALAVSGLFDGIGGSVKLGRGRLSLGAYYTGLLYKKTANIVMTTGDFQNYGKPLDAPNLEGYFATRRALAVLTAEFPDLTSRTSLTIQGLAQFDLNGGTDTLDTHYVELRFAAELADPLHVNLGGVGELALESGELWLSAAAFAGLDWEIPGALPDLFSLECRWTGGETGSMFRAFTPVSGKNAGRIFNAGTSALMKAGLSYRARLGAGFSLEAGADYFIRTDLETLADAELDGASESRLLGPEMYGSLVWAPDAAIRISAGGGAFNPRWGEAFPKNTPVRWKANLGLIISL